jgi:hypothetical protein
VHTAITCTRKTANPRASKFNYELIFDHAPLVNSVLDLCFDCLDPSKLHIATHRIFQVGNESRLYHYVTNILGSAAKYYTVSALSEPSSSQQGQNCCPRTSSLVELALNLHGPDVRGKETIICSKVSLAEFGHTGSSYAGGFKRKIQAAMV